MNQTDNKNTHQSYNVLVVDDDDEIRNVLEIYLKSENFNVHQAKNGTEALDIIRQKEIHIILMDIMMPKMDGIQATLKIRKEKEIPIIMLTARSEDNDVILGLNIGADDYITKPFKMMELIARVKSNLRRYVKFHTYKSSNDLITVRGLSINKKTKEVKLEGTEVRLTPIEFKILQLLMENAGVIFSMEQIYESVWNEPFLNGENTVAVHIRRIREKIEINTKNPIYLKVVWGVGYKIDK